MCTKFHCLMFNQTIEPKPLMLKNKCVLKPGSKMFVYIRVFSRSVELEYEDSDNNSSYFFKLQDNGICLWWFYFLLTYSYKTNTMLAIL